MTDDYQTKDYLEAKKENIVSNDDEEAPPSNNINYDKPPPNYYQLNNAPQNYNDYNNMNAEPFGQPIYFPDQNDINNINNNNNYNFNNDPDFVKIEPNQELEQCAKIMQILTMSLLIFFSLLDIFFQVVYDFFHYFCIFDALISIALSIALIYFICKNIDMKRCIFTFPTTLVLIASPALKILAFIQVKEKVNKIPDFIIFGPLFIKFLLLDFAVSFTCPKSCCANNNKE